MQNRAKQNYPGSVAFYNTQPGNEVGLFYKASEPKRGINRLVQRVITCSIMTDYVICQ